MNTVIANINSIDNLSLLAGLNAGLLGVVLTIVSILPVLFNVIDPSDHKASAMLLINREYWRKVQRLWLCVVFNVVGTFSSLIGLIWRKCYFGAIAWICTFGSLVILGYLGVFLARRLAGEFRG